MSVDRVDVPPTRRHPIKNPIIEAGEPLRRIVATQMSDLYRSRLSPTDPSSRTNGQVATISDEKLGLGHIAENARVGAKKIQRLLEISPFDPSAGPDKMPPTMPDFSKQEVSTFLLEVYSHDPRLAGVPVEKRPDLIFTNIANYIFGKRPSPEGIPIRGRATSVELHFTRGSLADAIEFFLIEPGVLPEVPMQQPDEK